MRPAQKIMDLVGTEYGGNRQVPAPPSLYAIHWHGPSVNGEKPTEGGLRFHLGDNPEYDRNSDLVQVFTTGNDTFELWVGYPDKWQFHCSRREARRLAWYILWTWMARTEWFGLRRWIYYRALHAYVGRRKAEPAE